MRRRRNQSDARGRIANLRDVVIDLVAGKLTALTRLPALRHLDLMLVRVDEVVTRHTEACRRYLLDRATAPIAIRIALKTLRVLAALAGVALAAEPVHRNREVLVRLFTDRSERHRASLETLDDFRRRLDFLDWHRLAIRLELKQGAQRGEIAAVLINQPRVLLEQPIVAG